MHPLILLYMNCDLSDERDRQIKCYESIATYACVYIYFVSDSFKTLHCHDFKFKKKKKVHYSP